MEYERFFHYGNDPYAAKWYLLSNSSALPQRLLCRKNYAEKSNYIPFGKYKITNNGKKEEYCYVIVNIFDIPYNELQNFFILICNNDFDEGSLIDINEALSDITFKKQFTSSKNNRYKTIKIQTNTEEISNNYMSGINDIIPLKWNIDLPIIKCTNPQISEERTHSDVVSMDIDMDNTQSRPVACKRPIRNDELVIANKIPNNNLSIPITDLSPYDFPSENGNLNIFDNKALKTFEDTVKTKIYFLDVIDGNIKLVNNKFILYPDDQQIEVYPDIKDNINTLNKYLTYPTFYSTTNKNEILANISLLNETEYDEFNNFLRVYGNSIVSIVETDDIITFHSEIEKHKNNISNFYYTLYGLHSYMKKRNTNFTTYMEICASQIYRDLTLMTISNMLIRVYFAAKKWPIKIIPACINLYHLQNIKMTNEAVQQVLSLMMNSDAQKLIKSLLNDIIQQTEYTVTETGKIIPNSYFCNNLIAVDRFQQYIVQNNNIYLVNPEILLSGKTTTEINEKYKDLPSVVKNYNYGGVVSF